MPKLELDAQQRRALRAAAHPLHPVVLIGDHGLTDTVLEEIDQNLKAHELIKVHVAGAEREAREAMLTRICDALACAAVQHIGKTLIIYRPDPGKQAAAAGSMATRAVRKRSGPYIPKKVAAHGGDAKPPARERPATTPQSRPASRAARTGITHGIQRRTGSALTLRAGARRGRTSRS